MRFLWMSLCLMLSIAAAQAADRLPANASLTGLPGVFVGVSITGGSRKAMPSTARLIEEIQAQLRAGGIRPIDAGEMLNTPGMPCFGVRIDQWRAGGNPELLGWVCTAELREAATLQRDPSRLSSIVTWTFQPMVAVTPGGAFDAKARELVTSQVHYFIQAYKAANPPK